MELILIFIDWVRSLFPSGNSIRITGDRNTVEQNGDPANVSIAGDDNIISKLK